MTYRPHLDGIRAIAVLAVVLYHAHVPGFSGGFVGVDVFFVISGYLITGLLLQEFADTGGISIRAFVERRVRRLAPALFVVLAATLAASLALLSPIGGEQQGVAKSAVAAVLLSANHYFEAHTGGYFDAPRDTFPLLHTWSLSVEEQFYLIWPWLVLAMARYAPAWVGRILAFVFIASLAACVWLTPRQPEAAFFLMPFRAWEFAIGGLAWLLLRRAPPAPSLARVAAWGGLACVLASALLLDESMAFPGWIAVLPVVGSAALIFGVEGEPDGGVARLLSTRVMVFFGLISYSLYLWHWPMLSIARTVHGNELGLALSLLLCAGAAVLGWLSYRFVEDPIRRRRAPFMTTARQCFTGGSLMMATVLVGAVGLGAWAKFAWPRLGGNAAMQHALLSLDTPRLAGCMQPRPFSGRLVAAGNCSLPRSTHPPEIVVWGDSHAFHLQPLMSSYSELRKRRARMRLMAGCPPLLDFDPDSLLANGAEGCVAFNQAVLREIKQLRSNGLRTVVIGARWPKYFATPQAARAATAGVLRTLAALYDAGVKTVVIGPLPTFERPVPPCLLRRQAAECGITRARADAQVAQSLEALRKSVARFSNSRLVEPLPRLCGEDRCEGYRGDAVLFYDDNHLSVAGSRSLLPVILPQLDWSLSSGSASNSMLMGN